MTPSLDREAVAAWLMKPSTLLEKADAIRALVEAKVREAVRLDRTSAWCGDNTIPGYGLHESDVVARVMGDAS